MKHKQLSAEPDTSIPIHGKEHHTKCNFHETVVNNTECVFSGNAKTEQFKLHFRWLGRSFVLSMHMFYAFLEQFKFRRGMSQ